MTSQPLSPAAQAVLDACNEAVERLPLTAEPEQFSVAMIAAALKVAANDWRIDTEFIGGVEYIRTSTLDAIAAELDEK
jgi:hypothetical protein